MKDKVFMVELHRVDFDGYGTHDSRIVTIWAFSTMKKAATYGEYKHRIGDCDYYRIIRASVNPEFFRLDNPYYGRI